MLLMGKEDISQNSINTEEENENRVYGGVSAFTYAHFEGLKSGELTPVYEPEGLKEENIYTFLQGPVAWESKVPYSGSWCREYLEGGNFGSFGCGMCCIANIYSTLSGYTCSPIDAYDYARSVSGYSPTPRSGAIGWGDLKNTLKAAGFSCDVFYKPDNYEAFRDQIKEAKSAVVLVSSYDDDTFWKDTPGHYVNIWAYDEKTDKVFLAEPGDPVNNRTWVPLEYVYDALKTISKFQYLLVTDYIEENNNWKHDGIDIDWCKPEDF